MTTGRGPFAVVLIVLAIAITAAGCGDGENVRAVATNSLGEAAFEQRAEAICADGRLHGLRFSRLPADGESEREALTRAVRQTLLPALQRVVDRLYSLGAPAGEEEQIEDFLAAFQHSVTAAERLRVPTLRRVEEKLEPAGVRAERGGLEACIYS